MQSTPPALAESPRTGDGQLTGLASRKRRRDNGRSVTKYARKRAVTACQLCRARKTKCDNQRPTCSLCASLDADCHYENRDDHFSFDPASLEMLDKLNRILDGQQHVLSAVRNVNVDMLCSPSRRGDIAPTHSSTSPVSPRNENETLTQLLGDSVEIPSSHTVPDSILTWPIFDGKYPPQCLQASLFASALDGAEAEEKEGSELPVMNSYPSPRAKRNYGYQEDEVLSLIEQFIFLVHIKNPILDEDVLRRKAYSVVEDGLGWDGSSCLVLLACALGIVATPFESVSKDIILNSEDTSTSTSPPRQRVLEKAEAYFMLARKRIGLLSQSMLAIQCHFLSGIFLMYCFKPLEAFQNFHQASMTFQIYFRSVTASIRSASDSRAEQRLFWSCFKSECEILSEIDLPQSGVGILRHLHTFPSPPDLSSVGSPLTTTDDSTAYGPAPAPASASSAASQSRDDALCILKEQSWFYYLSEIALRRIGNRVLSCYYFESHDAWMDLNTPSKIQVATELLRQLDQWYECLPHLVRYHEDGQETQARIPQEELPYMLRVRCLEIRALICRPFLFYMVHNVPAAEDHDHDPDQRSVLRPFITQALYCSRQLIESISLRHRHHGTWYTLRLSTICALSIYAAAKRNLAPDGWEASVRLTINTLQYWENEAPRDIRKAREILQALLLGVSKD